LVQTIGVGSMASVIPPGTFEIRRAVVVTIYVVVSIFGRELHIAKKTEKKTVNGECIDQRPYSCFVKGCPTRTQMLKVIRELK